MAAPKGRMVSFTIDGQQHQVSVGAASDGSTAPVTASTSLADYLRDQCGLRGTKVMCRGGMCGACVVTARVTDPATGQTEVRAVNSCLAPVHNCQGWQIETVQAIGDRKAGYHPAQSRLAQMNGTQCGYCSPGMVMSMYSLLESGEAVTPQSVEQHLDGNLCRCTGYRPILDAFKTFVPEADEKTQQIIKDIEDVAPSGSKAGSCAKKCSGGGGGGGCVGCPRTARLASDGAEKWSYPTSLAELCAIIKANPADKTLKLVRGNTGTGVYHDAGQPDGYVSLLKVPELSQVTQTASALTLGAAVSLSRVIEEFQKLSSTAGFGHFSDMASHLLLVANTPVRNAGSWAGNLMLKQTHGDFPSDVFLLLAAAGGRLQIADEDAATTEISVEQLLSEDMARKVIVSVTLPTLDETKYVFKSYKITPRAISAHAYVNAAFVLPLDASFTVVEKPTLLFGGISADFVHAANTEAFLEGRSLTDEQTVQGALAALQAEVVPTPDPAEADPAYRRSLACALLYKVVLRVLGDQVPAPLRSGGEDLTHPVSSGTQQFDTDQTLWPVNKAVPKLEAQAQTSGEAKYTGDEPAEPDELVAVYVQTTIANGQVASVDTSAALAVPGVAGYVSAADIAGVNNICSYGDTVEELFTSGQVLYYGQAVGLIVADTYSAARTAAGLVKITYTDVQPPVLTIKDALKKQGGSATAAPAAKTTTKQGVRQVIGEFSIGGQYHFTMETQTVRAVPRDDDQLDLFSATQDMRDVNKVVSQITTLPMHKINMSVRRLGGGYGSKLQHPSRVASAAAVAALTVNKPVRLVLDIRTNMTLLGGRLPYLIQYQAEADETTGKISSLQIKFTADAGAVGYAADDTSLALDTVTNVYEAEGWQTEGTAVLTNTASNTWCRAPGTVQGVSGIECVMDHLAHELGMDPWALRQANFFGPDTKFRKGGNRATDYDVFMQMVTEMFSEADIDARKAEIAQFNQDNRWRKRALSLVPVRWPILLFARYPTIVSIYKDDGTVAVSTGGVEMGQGLNTKVAQVCAKVLGIPLELVSVKPNMNIINPNGDSTGGSVGSDMSSLATKAACEEMNERLAPFKAEGSAWADVVKRAFNLGVNLTAYHYQKPILTPYNIFALAAVELEMDVLTGQYRLNRTDLYEDAGQSLSPAIDIGQCEGAFIMGMGLHMGEENRYDTETGRKLTDSSWNYYVPSSKDIPTDFRVKLIKNNDNPIGIFNSKATGEPPLCTTYAAISALRQAVAEARKDAGHTDWTQLDAPGTVEKAQTACQLSPEMFVIS
ncbi:indole-3-acetaldehyde oxidase-like [Amphibalanus amphitrite]|uniref:indole-3-acetaldehyde oxidase-like n=1 Tax=Amphibalanus amphitrite TaxID=1232801 RepID=UPI001C90B02B|nr:indole-3-acetaldehyde oxidase-like [Amphibalanus amphitrite]